MSKIYLNQPLRIEADCGTDVATGTPGLVMKVTDPNGVVTTPAAALVPGETNVIFVDIIVGVLGDWRYQPKITDAAYPTNPYPGETQGFTVYADGQ